MYKALSYYGQWNIVIDLFIYLYLFSLTELHWEHDLNVYTHLYLVISVIDARLFLELMIFNILSLNI